MGSVRFDVDYPDVVRVGVVADTHGWVHPRLIETLAGVDLILHAGDICGIEVIRALERVAPVVAVRGNNDTAGPCADYPEAVHGRLAGHRLYLAHIVTAPSRPRPTPVPEDAALVVYGHSHMPYVEWHGATLYFNPGAAGKPRFRSRPTVGLLQLRDGGIDASVEAL